MQLANVVVRFIKPTIGGDGGDPQCEWHCSLYKTNVGTFSIVNLMND
jgi:hypothetical protein